MYDDLKNNLKITVSKILQIHLHKISVFTKKTIKIPLLLNMHKTTKYLKNHILFAFFCTHLNIDILIFLFLFLIFFTQNTNEYKDFERTFVSFLLYICYCVFFFKPQKYKNICSSVSFSKCKYKQNQ